MRTTRLVESTFWNGVMGNRNVPDQRACQIRDVCQIREVHGRLM